MTCGNLDPASHQPDMIGRMEVYGGRFYKLVESFSIDAIYGFLELNSVGSGRFIGRRVHV